jgi:hypothetical protein
VDAITDRDADTHRYFVESVFPKLGEMETSENVLMQLEQTLAP